MSNKSDVKKVRNKELYDLIYQMYMVEGKSQMEVAKAAGITLGYLKNFVWRYGMNKKELYTKEREYMYECFDKGYKIKDIAKLTNKSPQTIYIYREQYEKGK